MKDSALTLGPPSCVRICGATILPAIMCPHRAAAGDVPRRNASDGAECGQARPLVHRSWYGLLATVSTPAGRPVPACSSADDGAPSAPAGPFSIGDLEPSDVTYEDLIGYDLPGATEPTPGQTDFVLVRQDAHFAMF